jgi:Gpi18-like mannosyltransferase
MTSRALIVLALGLLPRVFGLPLWGTFDVEIQKAWAWRAATGGVADIYGPRDIDVPPDAPFPTHVFEWNGASYFVDYPPGSVLVLWAEGRLYRAFDAEMRNRRPFNAAINLAAFIGSLVIAWRLWRSSPEHGARRAALFWLNPAMILCVPILGYQDTIFGALALAALLALQDGRTTVASAWIAAATLVKPQGALLLPLLGVAVLRDEPPRRWAASALAGLATAALILAPWWTTGHLLSAIDGCLRPLRQPTLAPLGLNVWWIAGYAMRWAQQGPWPVAAIETIDDFERWAGFDPRLVGRMVLLAVTGAIATWLWRRGREDRAAFAVAAAVQVHAYALLSTSVHENHTFFAVLAAIVAVGTWPRSERVVAATSAFLLVNVFLMAGGLGRRIMTLGQLQALRLLLPLDASIVVALLHVVLVAALVFWARSRPPSFVK